jgi:hypothetical protein
MKALALVIGNSNYPNQELKNPVNDANDFGIVLKRLGFTTVIITNVTLEEQDTAIDKFGNDLDNFEIGLFYFAGHGCQIDGENFLTVTNTNFSSESSAKYSSTPLNKILRLMEKAKNATNILILDACRNNPYERGWSRGSGFSGLAPIHAPKGTIIAFATSPGEMASDGVGKNGLYTSALLNHICDEKIPIEEFFKRVRNSVFAFSTGKQTSWEHTSLSGTFYFNSGQLVQIVDTPYVENVIIDKKYESEAKNSLIDEIIISLKSHNWYTQNPAIDRIISLHSQEEDRSKIFLLGRNILQAASGGSNSAIEFINNLSVKADRFTINNENDLINGILFEIYFNSSGKFRGEKLKNQYLDEVLKIFQNEKYKNSLYFIEGQLKPYADNLFFIPTDKLTPIIFDIVFDGKKNANKQIEYKLRSIKYEGVEILQFEDIIQNLDEKRLFEPMLYNKFIEKIEALTSIPKSQLKITSAIELDETSKILFPYGATIIKK